MMRKARILLLLAIFALMFFSISARAEDAPPPAAGIPGVTGDGNRGLGIERSLGIGGSFFFGASAETAFTDGDTTPSVAIDSNFVTANTAPTTITRLDDLIQGELGIIRVNDTNTTFDCTGSNIIGNGGSDYTAAVGDLIFYYSYDGTNVLIGITKPAAGGSDSDAIHDNVAGEISAVTGKTTPVDADMILIEDSAASNAKKMVTLTNLWSNYLKAKADVLYEAAGAISTHEGAYEHAAAIATQAELDAHTGAASPHSGHVDTSGDETIAGIKTFSSIPELPAADPTTDNQAARKAYVDAQAGTDTDAIHDNVAAEISAVSQEGSALEGTDVIIGEDAQNSYAKIRILLSEILTYITTNITSMDIKYDAAVDAGHPLNGDDSYSGMPITGINAGEAIAQWDLVYYDTTATEWLIADADASGEAPAWGMAVAAGTDGNPMDVLQKGFVRNDAWNWTPGAHLYLDDTTPGGITATAPSTSTDIVQPVAIAYTADIIWLNVDPVFNYTRVQ